MGIKILLLGVSSFILTYFIKIRYQRGLDGWFTWTIDIPELWSPGWFLIPIAIVTICLVGMVGLNITVGWITILVGVFCGHRIQSWLDN